MATSVDNGELSDMEGVLSELEVLQSIYVDELVVSYKDNRSEPWEISLTLHPATAEDQNSQYVRFTLLLSLSSQYPDAAPRITIQNPRGLSDEQIQHIRNSLTSVADAGIGGPVLYEIIEKGKEILTSNNVPYCQCVICLYGFQENEAFTKTECYHYFHSNCLARYIQHTEEELEMERMENERNKIPPPQQEPGVPCPVCRTTLAYDLPSLLSASPPQLPSESYIPDGATLKRMEELQLIFKRQQAKGGIIDPEAEKNRYLIRLQEVMNARIYESDEESIWSEDDSSDDGFLFPRPSVIVPYSFEPCYAEGEPRNRRHSSDSSDGNSNGSSNDADKSDQEFDRENRKHNTEWCQCGACVPMDTDLESLCCKESTHAQQKLEENAVVQPRCITEVPDFSTACLTPLFLRMLITQLYHFRGRYTHLEWSNRLYCDVALRAYALWVYERGLFSHRVVIPSCVVDRIRHTFPSLENPSVGILPRGSSWSFIF